jgi:glycosyltransferase involved in cell wall biosynthesis
MVESEIAQGISIIICFYNTGEKIVPTLEHIISLNTIGISNLELILVNNCSTDNTTELIHETLKNEHTIPWKIVNETNPGLTNARLKGIHEAAFNLLLFCDDDNQLSKNYLVIGSEILNTHHKIAVLGGKGIPISTVEIPDWFEKEQNFYACGPQFTQTGRVIGSRNVVYGAGMFVRKKCWQDICARGFIPISSDRQGGSLSSGGDSEMCLAFQIAGYYVWYDERLLFQHFIEPKRLTLDYLNRLKKGMSTSRFITRFYLDYFNGYIPKITRFFWLKELIYILCEKKNYNAVSINRTFSLVLFLIIQQSNYNRKVMTVIETCLKLENRIE